MELDICDMGGGVVRVAGELDVQTAPALARCLDEIGPITALDLRAVTFVNSAGLGVLVRAALAAETRIMVQPSAALLRLLELTGMLNVFCIDVTTEG
jgi:anti-sigma B factor antagonist